MIKINWAQVKSLKANLLRRGYTKDTDLLVMVFYRGKVDSERIKVKLEKLDTILFAAESNTSVNGIFVFDTDAKQPLWRVREEEVSNALEHVPSSGHAGVIRDFSNMSPEQRDVWIDITEASIMQHIAQNEV